MAPMNPTGPERLVPPLRSDVTLEEIEENGEKVWRLADRRFCRRIRLDRRGREVVVLLDRPQPFQSLLERIALTGAPMAYDALHRVLDAFAGLGLIEGSVPEVDENGSSMAPPPTEALQEMTGDGGWDLVPLLIPEDLRFSCTQCGSCCLGVNVGPVEKDIAKVIRDGMGELESKASRAPFFTMVPDDGDAEILVCQTRNGACVFLDPDGLCRIHRRLGPRAKPLICRLFPFRFVWSPVGVIVGLQTECRDILSASLGIPVREQEKEIREILSLVPQVPRVRSHLSIDGEVTCSYTEYLVLEREILAAVEAAAGGGGWAMLLAGTEVLQAQCRKRTAPKREAQRVELYSLLRDVGEALMRLKGRHYEEGGRIRFHTQNLDMLVEALRDSPLFVRTILSGEDGEAARFARLVIVNYWRSRDESFGPPDLVTSASGLTFAWFMTRAMAVSRARQVHRFTPGSKDLVDAWVTTHMLLRNRRVREALEGFRDRIRQTFADHLADLLEGRSDLEQTNPQTDFYLF